MTDTDEVDMAGTTIITAVHLTITATLECMDLPTWVLQEVTTACHLKLTTMVPLRTTEAHLARLTTEATLDKRDRMQVTPCMHIITTLQPMRTLNICRALL